MTSIRTDPREPHVRFAAGLTWGSSTEHLSITANASQAACSPAQRMQNISFGTRH